MSAFEDQPVVGLFGTCGDSTFRQDLFIPAYQELKIPFFNPQVPAGTWKDEYADNEADHLAHDVVQCWPVLGCTYGGGSLGETGFSIASSLRAPTPLPKFIIPMIEMELSDDLTDDVARKESIRARTLVAKHLALNESPNVFVVSSLEEMLETSIILFGAAKALVELGKTKNPAYARFLHGRTQQQAFARALESGNLGQDVTAIAARK